MGRSIEGIASAARALGLAVLLGGSAWAGSLHDGTRGAALYPGNAPRVGPYDGPVPGWRPVGRGDAGPAHPTYHPWGHRSFGPSIPGLWRYPSLHGFLPPTPHDDCLYQTGRYPWRRG